MKATSIFSLRRFGLLWRQNLTHHYKLISFSLGGLSGGLFILFLLIQLMTRFEPLNVNTIRVTFIFSFIVLGIIYAGTAFPGLRTREKSYVFLLSPASIFEKFLFEYLVRIVVFILAMPIIFWLVYVVEGYFGNLIFPDFNFIPQSLAASKQFTVPPEASRWIYVLIPSAVMLIYHIPFTGSTIFMKYPLLKTLFSVAVIFFFHVFLIFFLAEVLNLKEYHTGGHSILIKKNGDDVIKFAAIYLTMINLALLVASYLKLKEKEV